MLVLGGSTGNGLEHIDSAVTADVTVIDINPEYLRRLGEQFPNPDFALHLRCVDLADAALEPEAFDLVHAALVLEYLDWSSLLPRVVSTLKPGGVLSVVLQLPSATSPAVTPSPYGSLQALESLFQFVEPDALIEAARKAGLTLTTRLTEPLPSGKAFDVLRFAKSPATR